MTIQQLLSIATANLQTSSDSPRLDAEILLAYVLKKTRSDLYKNPETIISEPIAIQFQQLMQRRLKGEPIAYLTGTKEFWSLSIDVNHDTLIPRAETELLVETVLNLFPEDEPQTIADLGTGSGAIALSLAKERPHFQIVATDISERALALAKCNAEKLKLQNITFYQGTWCQALPSKRFNAILANPPYISEVEWQHYAKELQFEPKEALISGLDGLTALRSICQAAPHYLSFGGYLIVEHGFQQGETVSELFTLAGFCKVQTLCDLGGRERVTMGQWAII